MLVVKERIQQVCKWIELYIVYFVLEISSDHIFFFDALSD